MNARSLPNVPSPLASPSTTGVHGVPDVTRQMPLTLKPAGRFAIPENTNVWGREKSDQPQLPVSSSPGSPRSFEPRDTGVSNLPVVEMQQE